jgi:tyrosinase
MKFLHLVTLATAALALPSDILPARQTPSTCTSSKVRISWAQATSSEKVSYITAVLCLATKPSRLNIPTHSTLYDDFAYVHSQLGPPNQTPPVHGEAVFLPWHRYFVQVYEDALRTECGYTGAAMYWDWAADWAAPSQAFVWATPLGFGGNGSESADGNGPGKPPRIAWGPFRNLRPTYWYGAVDPHWLSRDWAPAEVVGGQLQPEMSGQYYSPTVMNQVNSRAVYEKFRPALEDGPHGGVHGGIGSRMGDMGPSSSPNGRCLPFSLLLQI